MHHIYSIKFDTSCWSFVFCVLTEILVFMFQITKPGRTRSTRDSRAAGLITTRLQREASLGSLAKGNIKTWRLCRDGNMNDTPSWLRSTSKVRSHSGSPKLVRCSADSLHQQTTNQKKVPMTAMTVARATHEKNWGNFSFVADISTWHSEKHEANQRQGWEGIPRGEVRPLRRARDSDEGICKPPCTGFIRHTWSGAGQFLHVAEWFHSENAQKQLANIPNENCRLGDGIHPGRVSTSKHSEVKNRAGAASAAASFHVSASITNRSSWYNLRRPIAGTAVAAVPGGSKHT